MESISYLNTAHIMFGEPFGSQIMSPNGEVRYYDKEEVPFRL